MSSRLMIDSHEWTDNAKGWMNVYYSSM
jgi:hypothetical protein